MNKNLLLLTDSYKVTHWKQYPPKTEKVYSYFESRGGRFPAVTFFGLQYYIKEYLMGKVVTEERIQEAKRYFAKHFGTESLFNEAGWRYILEKYDGHLPIEIKAIPEGMTLPVWNVLMTVENTDSKVPWLTNYLETLLVQVWYGSTIATNSRETKKMMLEFLEQTGDPKLIDFKLHDFGFRGVSSVETAAMGGAAHLVNFKGTDTMAGFVMAGEYYGADMAGYSIPAAEHSTMTAWGMQNEDQAMENMIDQYTDCPLIACVSDSYNIFKACSEIWGTKLKAKVMARNGTLVIRPDSGNPTEVILKVLDILSEKFGISVNDKGYDVLDPHVRIIQGDGVDYHTIAEILYYMEKAGYSADNIAFGSGGALLQKWNRDTQKFAFKCSAVTVEGQERDVYKCPVTDTGKISKAGRLKLIPMDNAAGTISYQTVNINANVHGKDILETVFKDGKLVKEYTFDQVRERAKI